MRVLNPSGSIITTRDITWRVPVVPEPHPETIESEVVSASNPVEVNHGSEDSSEPSVYVESESEMSEVSAETESSVSNRPRSSPPLHDDSQSHEGSNQYASREGSPQSPSRNRDDQSSAREGSSGHLETKESELESEDVDRNHHQ